ncbi:MAG TPA: dienelactone hydrolase family protein [Kofleriaceae bacterium]|nr:dienelactone hydrolase family protein [Kofleriaceae bacterium]
MIVRFVDPWYLAGMRTALLLVAIAACSSSSSQKPPSIEEAKPTNTPAMTGPLSEAEFKALHEPPSSPPQHLHGQVIDLAGTKAYLSLPEGKGPFPAIVVIHEWWGLNGNIEHWADRLAGTGWAALAVDLYGGKVATTPDEAMAVMKAVDQEKAKATISAAFDFVSKDARIAATKKVVMGWCFGGGWSLQTALAHPELDGAIIYYGQLETDPAKLGVIKGQLLGVFGNKDKGIPPAKVDEFETALKTAGVKATIYRYDAEHAFANPSNPKYDEKSAGDAWSHVVAFLDGLKT